MEEQAEYETMQTKDYYELKEIEVPLYLLKIRFMKVYNMDKANQDTNLHFFDLAAATFSSTEINGEDIPTLAFKKFNPGVIAHEALHACMWICDRKQVQYNHYTEAEAICYLLTWMVDELHKFLYNISHEEIKNYKSYESENKYGGEL